MSIKLSIKINTQGLVSSNFWDNVFSLSIKARSNKHIFSLTAGKNSAQYVIVQFLLIKNDSENSIKFPQSI